MVEPKKSSGDLETGLRFLRQHQPLAALGFFTAAAEEIPGAWAMAGYCHYALGHYEQAIELYQRAPPSEVTHNGVAGILYTQARPREALRYLLEYCREPWSDETQSNLSFIYLGLGKWDVGWKLFRRRHPPALKLVDNLEDIRAQNVIICAEPGNGDFIQGWRWAALLAEMAAEVRVWVPRPLRGLVEAQGFRTVDDAEGDALLRCGWAAVPALDCPFLFETTPETIPGTNGYLQVPPETIERRKLPGAAKFRVGLAWQGSARTFDLAWHYTDARRSVPFETMASILALADTLPIEFFSLQMPDHHRDHPNLIRVLDGDWDYLDTAAIVEQMDLVISVDTSVAHLAGALGKPVWLLNRFAGCWRWGWDREFSWYNTMRQYRQLAYGTWPEVIGRVRDDLALMVSDASSRDLGCVPVGT